MRLAGSRDAEKPPAFQFYAKAWLSSTRAMPHHALGVYIDFLAWSWDNGPLPSDEKALAVLAGMTLPAFRRVWQHVGRKWESTDVGLVNLRLEQQRKDLTAYLDEQSKKGQKGAAARWQRHPHGHNSGNGPGMHQLLPDSSPEYDSSSASSPSTSAKEHQDRVAPSALMDAWNDGTKPPIPRCRGLTPKRERLAASRLHDHPIDEWRQIIGRIQASAFCRGENDRGWVATFDWLLQADVGLKVLEGKYDNRPVKAKGPDAHRRSGTPDAAATRKLLDEVHGGRS
jgi:uncharacterized protein YdaU (DUF1376 family)